MKPDSYQLPAVRNSCFMITPFKNCLSLKGDDGELLTLNFETQLVKMRKLLGIVPLVVCSFNVIAQAQPTTFPGSFIGHWKGNLQWIRIGQPTQTFAMQLKVLPMDSLGFFTWQIIYGEQGKDNRPYLLKPVDSAKGHWQIDENNGIVLDNYVFDNCLKGVFSVSGNTISNSYCLQNGLLKVEFTSVKLANKKVSGKGTGDVPLVESYPLSSYQVGVLQRVDSTIVQPIRRE